MAESCHVLVFKQWLLGSQHIADEYFVALLPLAHHQVADEDIEVYLVRGVFVWVLDVLPIFFILRILNQSIIGDALLQIVEWTFFVGHFEHLDSPLEITCKELLDSKIVLVVVEGEILKIAGWFFLNFCIPLKYFQDHLVCWSCY